MAYKNRTMSYTFSGTLGGTLNIGRTTFTSPDSGGGEFVIELGEFVRFTGTILGPTSIPSEGMNYGLKLDWIRTGFGGPTPFDAQFYAMATLPPTLLNLTGSYSVTIQLDEIVGVTQGGPGPPDLTDELTADIDLAFAAVAIYGGSVTAVCDYGINHVESTAIVGIHDIGIVPQTFVQVSVASENHTGVMSGQNMSSTPLWNGSSLAAIGGSASNAHGTGAWGGTVSVSADPGYSGLVQFAAQATTRYDLQGVVYAMDVPYPDSGLIVRVATKKDPTGMVQLYQDLPVVGGAFGIAITQDSWSYGVTLSGASVASGSLNEPSGVLCTLLPSGLIACGEDPDLDFRHLWMRGWHWNAATIGQAATLNALSGSWSATGAGGTITVPASAFNSSIKGASWVGASLAGYAFADVYLTADAAGQAARVHFGSKYWDVTVGTSGSVRIDLCSPTSSHTDIDPTNTQYPLTGGGPYTAQDGWSFGVRNTPSVVIDGLASGHTYTLTGITLVRTDHSRVTFLDSFKAWELAATPVPVTPDVTSYTYYRQAHTGDTDGQQSLEQTDAVRLIIAGTETSDNVSLIDIKTFVANVNGQSGAYPTDGWSASDLQVNDGSANVRSGLLNSDQPSSLLFGSGLYYDGSGWISGIQKDASGTLTVPANFLYNTIQVYPGAGDPFGFGGGAGSPTPLRPAIILRSQAWGIASKRRKRGSGIVVTATDAGVSAGSGTTDSSGEYKTGLPFIRGLRSANITVQQGNPPYPFVAETFATRQRRRIAFGAPVTCCSLIFCSDYFYFPFAPQAGDHTRLPLDDWRQIPDVSAEDEDQTTTEKTPATVGGDR
ncbi:MAG: hypothetical protein JWL77_5335 [Chthonomonadaceae bacterium]|nr:hypothetical protein [Chthonomonadaceae bacterium]